MCQQTLHQHLCYHISHRSLTTCSTPASPGHHRTQTITSSPSVCSSCITRGIPVTNIPLQRHILSVPPPPYTSFAPPTIFLLPSTPPLGFVEHKTQPQIVHQPPHQTSQFIPLPHLYIPPPFPPYTPGQVPSWVPREIRHELIHNVLTPVEHFQGPAAPFAFGRGYNTFHGFDNGPLPPGLGATHVVNFSEMENPNLGVSTQSGDASGAGVCGGVKNAEGLKQGETAQGVDNSEETITQGSKENQEEGGGNAASSTKASSSAEKFGVSNETPPTPKRNSATPSSIKFSTLPGSRSNGEQLNEVPVRSTEESAAEDEAVRQ